MSKSQMTPGPWRLGAPWAPPNGGRTVYGGSGANEYVADVYAGHHEHDAVCRERGEANARAIAALPDLVETLRKADAYLRDPSTASATVGSRSDVLVEIASALAKLDAEGGDS